MSDTGSTFHTSDFRKDGQAQAFLRSALEDKDQFNYEVERQAELNIAWCRGLQTLFWHALDRRLIQQPNPNGRVRLTYNLMRGLVEGYAAKLAEDTIRLSCERTTDDYRDWLRAQIQTKILHAYQYLLDFDTLVDESDLYAVMTGEAYIKVCWDADKGSYALPDGYSATPDELDMEPGELDRLAPDLAELRKGDLSVYNVPVFNLYWGPDGATFDEADWVVEVYERSKAHVLGRYDLSPDDLTSDSHRGTRVWRPGQQRLYSGGYVSRERDKDTILVIEAWIKPNKKIKGLERGRHIIEVGGTVVENDANPYDHQKIPIVRFPLQFTAGDVRAYTPVTDLIPPQADINRAISQFCENRELMANPTWSVPENAIVDINEWSSAAGSMRRFRGQQAPNIVQGATMPNNVLVMIDKSYKFMQDIIGLRDASVGKNPAGSRSGSMVSLLKEADDERLGRVARRRREAWRQVGELMLSVLAQYATEERVIHLAGDESANETLAFSGADIASPDGRYDVKVVSKGVVRSATARRENVQIAMQGGFLSPENPRDRSIVLETLEFGDQPWDIDPTVRERRTQRRRNMEMLRGQYERPNRYEDINILRQELNEFRKLPLFEQVPDETKAIFQQYEDDLIAASLAKEQYLQQQVQRVMQQNPQLAAPQQPPQPQQ
jgi:hypothetical protein